MFIYWDFSLTAWKVVPRIKQNNYLFYCKSDVESTSKFSFPILIFFAIRT